MSFSLFLMSQSLPQMSHVLEIRKWKFEIRSCRRHFLAKYYFDVLEEEITSLKMHFTKGFSILSFGIHQIQSHVPSIVWCILPSKPRPYDVLPGFWYIGVVCWTPFGVLINISLVTVRYAYGYYCSIPSGLLDTFIFILSTSK